MTTKNSYNTKDIAALTLELATLRAAQGANKRKAAQGRNINEYRANKKNIARILIAMNTTR